MALAFADTRISPEEYLEGELSSEIKHEYIAGQVYAMSGGTMNHQRVALNFLRLAGNALLGKSCYPVNSDFKIRIPIGHDETAFYYPDAAIICVPISGDALFTDSPSVILEVLSPSTRRTDEVQKLRDYVTIPTLRAYIVAEPDRPFLTVHRRNGDAFRREMITGPDAVLELAEVGISVVLTDLYLDVC